MLNVLVIILGGAAKKLVVDGLAGDEVETSWWGEMYDIMVLQFGQEMPEKTATFAI